VVTTKHFVVRIEIIEIIIDDETIKKYLLLDRCCCFRLRSFLRDDDDDDDADGVRNKVEDEILIVHLARQQLS
jgi:hypothetical protein